MKRQTALSKRTQKASALIDGGFYKVTALTGGHVKAVTLPGSEAKQYSTIMWSAPGAMGTECKLDTIVGGIACKGNSNGHICYHSIAALMVRAQASDHTLAFCQTRDGADRLARLGGNVVNIYSKQGDGRLYAVVS